MRYLYALAVSFTVFTSFGQLRILKDANDESQGKTQASMGNSIGSTALFNGRLYFSAYQQVTLDQVWSTDGTEDGTTIVKTPLAGDVWGTFAVMDNSLYMSLTSNDSSGLWKFDKDMKAQWVSSTTGSLITSGSELIYFPYFKSGHYELWRTDGTTDGTIKLVDAMSNAQIIMFEDHVFFTANDGVHGKELWITDGTLTGTKMIKDIDSTGDGISNAKFQIINGELYFCSKDQNLWKTDGTESGTLMIGPFTSIFSSFTAGIGNKWLVGHQDNNDGEQFYIFDLTTHDFTFFRDIIPGPWADDEAEPCATVFKGAIYFILKGSGSYELWKTDGTEANTSVVYSFDLPQGARLEEMWTLNDKLYIEVRSADDSQSSILMSGDELNKFTTIFTGSYAFTRLEFGDKFITVVSDGIHDYEPWISDGTAAGTHILKDIETITTAGTTDIATTHDRLFIFNEDGLGQRSLWSSDGSESGTIKLTEGLPAYNLHTPLYVHGSKGFFVNDDGVHGKELWVTDGTPSGTFMLTDAIAGAGGSDIFSIVWKGDIGYFNVHDDAINDYQLWKTDGTSAGTVKVTSNGFNVSEAVQFKDQFYLSSHPYMLTKNDGSQEFPTDVKLIDPSANPNNYGYIRGLQAGANYMFFGADDGVHGNEMWISDGTDAGTHMVKDVHTASNDDATYSVRPDLVLNDVVYFVAAQTTDLELWRSDGSDAGTYMVKDINPAGSSNPSDFKVVGDLIYFLADDGSHGIEAWKTDGTASGTTMVKDIKPGAGSSYPFFGVLNGSTLYFTADDGVHGFELWSTDGTENNTKLLKDIHPGLHGAFPPVNRGVVANGHVYFSADDGTHGTNLWRTDGTPRGTLRIDGPALLDLPAGYYPAIVAFNDHVFFNALESIHGDEVWVYDPTVQTITFTPIDDKTFGDASFTVNATSSVSLDVQYSIVSGPATINGNSVTIMHAGTVTVRASQAGYDGILPAFAERSFMVSKADQTITFNPIADKKSSDAPFNLTASSSSGLPVTFSVTSGPATISGSMLAITGSGTITVEAIQPGNDDYNSASVEQSFNVELILGLGDEIPGIKISPNPATNSLIVQAPITFESLSLKDLLGRDAITMPISNENTTIDVAHLPRGMYIIALKTIGKSIVTRKIILR
jgi:ELWxxDGT repeat protein